MSKSVVSISGAGSPNANGIYTLASSLDANGNPYYVLTTYYGIVYCFMNNSVGNSGTWVWVIGPVLNQLSSAYYTAPVSTESTVIGLAASGPGGITFLVVQGTAPGPTSFYLGGTMERSAILEGICLVPEVTMGTYLPPTHRLPQWQAEVLPNIPTKPDRPTGTKGYIAVQKGKEWSTIKLSGELCLNASVWAAASLFGNVSTAGPVAVGSSTVTKKWAFQPSSDLADLPQTYSGIVGSPQAGYASQFDYGFLESMTIKVAKEQATFDGTMMASILTDGVTIPTSLPDLPVAIPNFDKIGVYYSTDGLNFNLLPKIIDAEFRFNGRWGSVIYIDDTQPSYSGLVEKAPDFGVKLTTGWGSDALNFLNWLRTQGQIYLQLRIQGSLIESLTGPPIVNYYNSLQITIPVFITKPDSRGNSEDVYVAAYDTQVARVPTFGLCQAVYQNKLTAIS